MLSPVGFGQARLTLPGLVPDARGVVSGHELLARFPTLERLVHFLRLLSGESVPDELWLGLRIMHARSGLGLREELVTMPNPANHAGDAVARAVRSAGGECFTGSGRHYVQYRDPAAPFGYDVGEIAHEPADVTLYAADATAGYRHDGELSVERLLMGLELRRRSGRLANFLPTGEGSVLYLTARRGVGARLMEHLSRAGVRAHAALCTRDQPSAFGLTSAFWLIRIEELPARFVALLSGTPGFASYLPVTPNVLVAAGYAHPIHLEACGALLGANRLVLFGAPSDGVTVLSELPRLLPVSDLIPLALPRPMDVLTKAVQAPAPPPFEIPFRLEMASTRPARAVAAWIPWSQASWLRRLCYALPPVALRGHRVALLEPALLVLGAENEPGGLAGIPFGQMLDEVAPRIFVPSGMRLVPAVSFEWLAERLGVADGTYVVFPAPGATPVRVSAAQIEPLERQILAHMRLEPERVASARRAFAPIEETQPPDVVHDSLGPWPLWGIRR